MTVKQSYGMKLETILQSAVEKGHISQTTRNDLLRTKFWSGLRDSELKNASRYKYETTKDFDSLRKEIRAIELEISNSKASSRTSVPHNPITSSTDTTLENILKKIEKMDAKMTTFENTLSEIKQERGEQPNRGGRGQRPFWRGRGNQGRYNSQEQRSTSYQPQQYGRQSTPQGYQQWSSCTDSMNSNRSYETPGQYSRGYRSRGYSNRGYSNRGAYSSERKN